MLLTRNSRLIYSSHKLLSQSHRLKKATYISSKKSPTNPRTPHPLRSRQLPTSLRHYSLSVFPSLQTRSRPSDVRTARAASGGRKEKQQ
ncbi:hypothetical protein TNCV_2967121 [Trichonephila clavipes]|nr:hypothetical protein TNCV_2967121 [Trichonephila clavipes]